MPAFRAKKAPEATPPEPQPVEPARQRGPAKKDRATPSRREAEAARRARLNPQLTKKEAKARERQRRGAQRQKDYLAFDSTPERQLLRDVVDSRFNVGEVAMPALLLMVAVTFVPAMLQYAAYVVYAMYAFLALMIVDSWVTWRRFKRLAAERLPGRSLKGLAMYSFNRQMSVRRWRTPAPRVKRGDQI